MRLGPSLVGLGILALGAVPRAAHADPPAARLVTRLASPLRNHALADETGRIPVLTALPPGTLAEELGLLPVAPGFGAIRLPPGELEGFAAAHPELSLEVGPPRHLLLDVSRDWTRAGAYRDSTCQGGAGVVVGVIDTGLDLRHADFRNADGSTRVAWMLKAGPPRGVFPKFEDDAGCTDPNQSPCAVLDSKMIDELISKDDDSLPRDSQGHGTHVTSIAAGNGGAMRFAHPVGTIGGDCHDDRAGLWCDEGDCHPLGCRHVCTEHCTSKSCPTGTYCGTIEGAKMCVPRKPA
jgi:hypothetical protein